MHFSLKRSRSIRVEGNIVYHDLYCDETLSLSIWAFPREDGFPYSGVYLEHCASVNSVRIFFLIDR